MGSWTTLDADPCVFSSLVAELGVKDVQEALAPYGVQVTIVQETRIFHHGENSP